MNEFLWQAFHRLISEVDTSNRRFLYEKLSVNHRLLGVVGARGVGKTTLLLQYIKNELYSEGKAFYFSADNIYFNHVTILDFVNQLYSSQGISIFFIDEIHKYPNWDQELKNIYDSFPRIKVIFSGSSSIDLVTGAYDLSRRAKLLFLPGLSFREYLNIKTGTQFPVITFEELMKHHQKLAADLSNVSMISKHFEEYRLFGYYPMVFQNKETLYEGLASIIEKTIYEDIANFYQLKTNNLVHFKRIIDFLGSIPPGNININNIARHLSVDNKTAEHYLEILKKTGMVRVLYPVAHGNQLLRKPSKVYLDNTTLHSVVNTFLSEKLDLGTQRELVFMQFLMGAGLRIFFSNKADFQVNDIIFEIGGKNKTKEQLKAFKGEKKLVKDDILVGFKNEIPLYLFGFLY